MKIKAGIESKITIQKNVMCVKGVKVHFENFKTFETLKVWDNLREILKIENRGKNSLKEM